jgi:hypothetical protein
MTIAVAPAALVKIAVFEAITGYTAEAVHTKVKRGVWREGQEYVRAPDGNILVRMKGFYRWAESQKPAG